jgi:Flp pilus assembly protein TadD
MPPSTAPLLAQAIRLLKSGRPAEAIAPLREAASLQPGNPTIQHDLGLACLEANRLPDAVAALKSAVAANPRYTDAWFRLGIALEKLDDAGSAIFAYDRTTELLPSHTEAWFRAGALVYTLGHVQEAIGCFRRAAATGPKTGFGRLGAARALLAENRDAEAEKLLRQTLALDPKNAIALDLLGNALADAGRFDDARGMFAAAVENAPLMAGTYYDLVRCRRVTPDDADLLPRMEQALGTPGLEDVHRRRLHLAIGKAADDLGDYATAMRHFDAADAIRRSITPFDSDEFDRQISHMIARVTPDLIGRAAARGNPDATPVIILGMPRSGTTLIEQIVSSHPDTAAGGELNFWNERGGPWTLAGAAGMEAPFLAEAACDYLAILRGIGPTATRVTDKMPFNFLWAGLIHLALPNATLIHCRRAPIDTALSIHQTQFNPRFPFPTGGPELVAYLRSYRRLTDHWRKILPPDRFLEIDYEDLTRAPETVIPRIIAATGLPWNECCLRPEQNPRVVKTPSKWQARQPIYRSAAERWRRYEPLLGPLAALLDEDTGTHS